jgi:hypothetical protein
MHVIAGFQSQIAARGSALALADAARLLGVAVLGAALARRDTVRAIHVDPVDGFRIPEHALALLDEVFEESQTKPSLRAGETALVVRFADVPTGHVEDLIDRTSLERRGALWVTTA